jgi:hypothetical protein
MGKKRGAASQKSKLLSGGDLLAIVPFEREFPPDQMAMHSNQFVIVNDGPEFQLLFFQNHPPIVLGDTVEERKREAQKIKSVRSVCVARIVVAAERLPLIIKAMQENLERSRARAKPATEAKPSSQGNGARG